MKPLVLICFLFVSGLSVRAQDLYASNTLPASGVNKTLLLQLVNQVRKTGCQCGDTWYAAAPPLSWNGRLETAAAAHSNDMSRNKYFSHTGTDGSTAGVRMENAGYLWRDYGENIASGYRTEQEVVAGWIKSPGHCKNIMNPRYTEMAIARSGNLWTQVFGTPK